MSYTMTFDMPQKTAEFVEQNGLPFRKELNALVLAFVKVRMQSDSEAFSQVSESKASADGGLSGLDFFNALRTKAPILDDEDMHVFDRVKDYGRKVDLT